MAQITVKILESDRNINEINSIPFDSGISEHQTATSSDTVYSHERKSYKQSEKREFFRELRRVNAPNKDEKNISETDSNDDSNDDDRRYIISVSAGSTLDSLERKLCKQNDRPNIFREVRRVNAPNNNDSRSVKVISESDIFQAQGDSSTSSDFSKEIQGKQRQKYHSCRLL